MRQSIRCVWAHANVNLDLELYGVCGEARGLCVISESIWAEVFTLFGARILSKDRGENDTRHQRQRQKYEAEFEPVCCF
jgi:hypothetical protein